MTSVVQRPRSASSVISTGQDGVGSATSARGSSGPRHVYATDDLALLIVDWVIEGTADGRPVRIEGTATDVARRGPDGRWRYAVDNPFGTAVP